MARKIILLSLLVLILSYSEGRRVSEHRHSSSHSSRTTPSHNYPSSSGHSGSTSTHGSRSSNSGHSGSHRHPSSSSKLPRPKPNHHPSSGVPKSSSGSHGSPSSPSRLSGSSSSNYPHSATDKLPNHSSGSNHISKLTGVTKPSPGSHSSTSSDLSKLISNNPVLSPSSHSTEFGQPKSSFSSYSYPSSSSGLSGSNPSQGSKTSTGLPQASATSHSSLDNKNDPLSNRFIKTHIYPSEGHHEVGSNQAIDFASGSPFHSLSPPNYHLNNNKAFHDYSIQPEHYYATNTQHLGAPQNYPSHISITNYNMPPDDYVQTYRRSGSRFSNLLTGLSLYNRGRLQNRYRHHYYNDGYHRQRHLSGYSNKQKYNEADDARCLLKVTRDGEVELLEVPCEIVSTFTEESTKLTQTPETQVNRPVCTTNSTMLGSEANSTFTSNTTMVNVTLCTTNSATIDPLAVKGEPLNAKNIECAVEIHTKEAVLLNNIDCNTLIEYSKKPEPKIKLDILPSRETLKSWLSKPPWWMSLFLAI